MILVGRGAGKNGYLAFEDFALLTPVNGVKYYHIDMFATSEDQAKATFEDIYNILEDKKDYFKNYFKWNLECITNIKTGSKLKYHTRAPDTKDGGRPGKVDFDEYHAYKDYKLIEVATGGLGKKQYPRRTIITTQGDVRDYLYFPDDGTNTEHHAGNQQFMFRGATDSQDRIVNEVIDELVKRLEET